MQPGRTDAADLITGALRVLRQPSRRGAVLRGILALASAAAGLLVGIALAAASPRPLSSDADVLFATPLTLAPAQGQAARAATDRLVAIASSRPVLAGAAEGLKPAMSVQALQRQVHVTIVGSNVIQISAQAATPARAQTVANAVASSYKAYADEKLPAEDTPMMLGTTVYQGPSHLDYILDRGGLGAMCGALLAAIAIAVSRRRMRWNRHGPYRLQG